MELIRTNNSSPDFVQLVQLLDRYLAEMDGDEHAFYATYNTLDALQYIIVAYIDGKATGCGAIKAFDVSTVEVKRMYTIPDARGKGIASAILTHLEQWARQLGYTRCVLETGLRQPEAIALYLKSGYSPIPNYGQYAGMANSRCFEKKL